MPDLFHRIQVTAPPEKVFKANSTSEFHFRVDGHRQDGVHWTCVEAAKVPDEWVGTELPVCLKRNAQEEALQVHKRRI